MGRDVKYCEANRLKVGDEVVYKFNGRRITIKYIEKVDAGCGYDTKAILVHGNYVGREGDMVEVWHHRVIDN